MSRERPTAAPKIVYGGERLKGKAERQARELEQLKQFSGPRFMGGLMASFTRGKAKAMPQFIRRGYEAGIVDQVNDFYRARPWRRRADRSGATRKERQKLLRRMENAGLIRRMGGGRFELARVRP